MKKIIMALLLTCVTQQSLANTNGPTVTCQIEEWQNNKRVQSYSVSAEQTYSMNQDGVTKYFDHMSTRVALKSDPKSFIAFKAWFEEVDQYNSMDLRVDQKVYVTASLNGRLVGTFSLPKLNVFISGCYFKDGERK